MTFDQFVRQYGVSASEREALVVYLAALRMRLTLEALTVNGGVNADG